MINGNKQNHARSQLINGFNSFIDEIENIYKIELSGDLKGKTKPLSPEDYMQKHDGDDYDPDDGDMNLEEYILLKIYSLVKEMSEDSLSKANLLSCTLKTLAESHAIDRSNR